MIYLKAFLVVAAIYSLIAAFSSVFYKNKETSELNTLERDILYGRATIGTRLGVLFKNLLMSIMAPQVHIVAGVITGIIYLFG